MFVYHVFVKDSVGHWYEAHGNTWNMAREVYDQIAIRCKGKTTWDPCPQCSWNRADLSK